MILEQSTPFEFLEITTEHFLWADEGTQAHNILHALNEAFPITLHGLSLSIASTDCLDEDYLYKLKTLADYVDAPLVSDHLSWTGIKGVTTHDLLPIPYTQQALEHIIPRIRTVQDYLKRPFAIENPSTYMQFSNNHYSEVEFIRTILEETSCYMLLDVNNVYVNAFNHGFCPYDYIDRLPPKAIKQIHLAGYDHHGTYLHDTHGRKVSEEVWDLYKYTIERFGTVATVIEWDQNTPSLQVMSKEAHKVQAILKETQAKQHQDAPTLLKAYDQASSKHSISYLACLERFQYHIVRNETDDTEWIAPPHHAISKTEQLAIYRNHYRMPLLRHLHDTYPATVEYLGEHASNMVFHHYIDHYLSTHLNQHFYGEALPSFLSQNFDQVSSIDDLKYPTQFIRDLCLFENTMARVSKSTSVSDKKLPADSNHHIINCTYDVITAYENWLDAEAISEPLKINCTIQICWHDDDVHYHLK
ncbi:MAG: DUF692 family protein [Rickettsiales bacterium]|nr:DUF692 family protein [Rickettsiales bacterium]